MRIDTINKSFPSLILDYKNQIKHKAPYGIVPMHMFVNDIEISTNIPTIYSGDRNCVFLNSDDFSKMLEKQNRDTLNAIMQRNGLTLKDNPRDTVNVVRIYYQ